MHKPIVMDTIFTYNQIKFKIKLCNQIINFKINGKLF